MPNRSIDPTTHEARHTSGLVYVTHVTLTSGHSRKSYRDEVGDEAVMLCADLIDQALDLPHLHAVIPRTDGCSLSATAEGSSLVATIWSPPVELRGSSPQRVPLVTLGVATRDRHGAKLWRLLHASRESQLQTSPEQVPGAPWVAARVEVGAALMPEAMHWCGDLERCLAWAWIER